MCIRDRSAVPLRELCMSLLGPLSGPVDSGDLAGEGVSGNAGRWVATVAGAEKRTLLREVVLPALAANRASQRLVSEIDELLVVAEKRAASAE